MRLAPPAFALLVAALVYVAPVSNVSSDAALQLVAAQALVEHRSRNLVHYQADPRLAYDLERDYRVVRSGAARRYYLLLPPVLDAPFVWLARRAGLDMLRPADEQALQDLLSALVCGLVALLCCTLCRRLVEPRVALAIAAVATLGSPLVSTLGTALWAAGPALIFTLLALLLVVRPGQRPGAARLVLVALLMACAYLCRPASAFAALGLMAAGLVALEAPARRRVLFVLTALLCGALVVAAWLGWRRIGMLVPIYYSPIKAWPNTPLGLGLEGTLLSPGRGLFVFCPFLLPVALGALAVARRLRREPLAFLAVTWIATQVLLTSVKPWWWGGNSYGPRLLLETIPAWALLACLVWRAEMRPGLRRALAANFMVLGLASVAIHAGQGLWNPAVQAWNRGPAAQLDPALLFDWRSPQFLASQRSVAARDLAWQRAQLQVLQPDEAVGADSRHVAYEDFHPLDGSWRPSRPRSILRFRPWGFAADQTYLLELRASTSSRQRWWARLHDWQAEAVFEPPGPFAVRLPIPGALLAGEGERELQLIASDARAEPGDARIAGPRFHGLRVLRLPGPWNEVRPEQDAPFLSGFADLEGNARWTVSREARLLLPDVPALGARRRLSLRANGNGTQHVELRVGDCVMGALRFDAEPATRVLEFECRPGRSDQLTLLLPGAHPVATDERQLGLNLVHLSVDAVQAIEARTPSSQ